MQQKKPASAENFEKFVSKCREVFGDRFTYFPEEFYKLRDDTKILDTITGKVFYQNAGNHHRAKWTPNAILEQLSKWNPNCSYKVLKSAGLLSSVEITCPLHGVSERTFRATSAKSTCPTCSRSKGNILNWEEVKARLQEKHPDCDFSQSEYKGMREPIKIILPDGREVFRVPNDFLRRSTNYSIIR